LESKQRVQGAGLEVEHPQQQERVVTAFPTAQPSPKPDFWRWVKSKPLRMQVVFLSLALLVVGAVVYFVLRSPESNARVVTEQLKTFMENLTRQSTTTMPPPWPRSTQRTRFG
jgi:hypothetical protein